MHDHTRDAFIYHNQVLFNRKKSKRLSGYDDRYRSGDHVLYTGILQHRRCDVDLTEYRASVAILEQRPDFHVKFHDRSGTTHKYRHTAGKKIKGFDNRFLH